MYASMYAMDVLKLDAKCVVRSNVSETQFFRLTAGLFLRK